MSTYHYVLWYLTTKDSYVQCTYPYPLFFLSENVVSTSKFFRYLSPVLLLWNFFQYIFYTYTHTHTWKFLSFHNGEFKGFTYIRVCVCVCMYVKGFIIVDIFYVFSGKELLDFCLISCTFIWSSSRHSPSFHSCMYLHVKTLWFLISDRRTVM